MQPTLIELPQDTGQGVRHSSIGEPDEVPSDSGPGWNPAQRIAFRFLFAYFILYALPFPLGYIPQAMRVVVSYPEIWNALVPWVGRHVFGVEITVRPNGSGDTTYNYVQVFCYAVIAAGAALVWTLLDRKRLQYARLYGWLRVYVRFYLATTLISYGAVKIIKAQFPSPSLDRLLQPFGDASPMGLLWTFMGVSESYNIFTGAGEVLGGLLLTTRRTTLLGALVSFGVLSHVTALNFCYDVPVKQFSFHLLAMSLFLMAPDLSRLAKLFLFNRGVEPAEIRPFSKWSWLNFSAIALRTLLVLYFVWITIQGAQFSRKAFGDLSPRSPLHGIWNVEEFEVDGTARPPLITDGQRWRRVVFDYPTMIAIQLMSDSRVRYSLALDPSKQTLAFTKRADPSWKATFSYQHSEPDLLAMEGTLDGRKIKAKLHRTNASDFLLINRGFHWINEYPFNR
jgi:hypothetical protein